MVMEWRYGHSGRNDVYHPRFVLIPIFIKHVYHRRGNHDNNIYSQFYVESHYTIDEEVKVIEEKLKETKAGEIQ